MTCPKCKSQSGFSGGPIDYECGSCEHEFSVNAKGKVTAGAVDGGEDEE